MCRPLAVLCLLGCAIPLPAQSWEELRGLRTGDRVLVLDSAGRQHKGAFASVTDDAISFTSGKSLVSVEKTRVRRVKTPSGSRRLRNALIGIGIGVAIGVTTDQTLGTLFRNEAGESSGARALTYIAPIGIFGGIAAALPAYKTIYRVH